MTDQRLCMSCGKVDSHPRHVHGTAGGDAPTTPEIAARALAAASDSSREAVLAQIMDTSTVIKHLDCCAADGCPDGSCDVIVPAADGAKGSKLREFLTSGSSVAQVGADLNARRAGAKPTGDDDTQEG